MTDPHHGYLLNWVVEGHLAYGKMWGELTTAGNRAWDLEVLKMLEVTREKGVIAHGIWDHTDVTKLPPIRAYLQSESARHPNIGWNIIINSPNSALKFVLSASIQLLNMRLRFVNSLDEAVKFLTEIDFRLQDIDVYSAAHRVAAQQAEFLKSYPPYTHQQRID